MKRTLEVVLLASALVLAGFVALRQFSRRPSGVPPVANADQEDPNTPAGKPYAPAVTSVPMIKLDHPPRRRPLKTDIPAPVVHPN